MKKLLFIFMLAGLFSGCVKEELDQTTVLNQEALDRGPTVPFQADFVTYPTFAGQAGPLLYLSIPGEGTATHMGNTTMFSNSVVDFSLGSPFGQTGDMLMTAANGATLIGSYEGTGQYDPNNPQLVLFTGEYTITGGTGRFAGFTGSGTYYGSAVTGNPTGLGELHFIGTLTKP